MQSCAWHLIRDQNLIVKTLYCIENSADPTSEILFKGVRYTLYTYSNGLDKSSIRLYTLNLPLAKNLQNKVFFVLIFISTMLVFIQCWCLRRFDSKDYNMLDKSTRNRAFASKWSKNRGFDSFSTICSLDLVR